MSLGDAGFRGYEISNWARPGHESRHNLAYWLRRPHEAVGPGAHAFDGVDAALERGAPGRVRRRRSPTGACRRAAREPIDPRRSRPTSALILALRLDTGLPLADAHEPPLGEHFGWALAAELVDVTPDDRVVLTTRGRLLSNELFAASSDRADRKVD